MKYFGSLTQKVWSTWESVNNACTRKNERAGKNGEQTEVEGSEKEKNIGIVLAWTDGVDNDTHMSIILNRI